MEKKGLDSWGFKAYPTENKNIIEYEGIDTPKNKMRSYLILPGIYVMYISLNQKYNAQESDYNGRFGYRIAYCYEGNYYTYINNTKVLITREIFVGKSIPKSIESYSTSEKTKAFNIVIVPNELDENSDFYELINNFIKLFEDIKDIGFIINKKETLFVANQLIENLKNNELFLVTIKTLELIYMLSKENINENRKKYYTENFEDEIIEIEKYFRENLEKDIDLDSICKKFKVSKTNFNNKFIRRFQYTPIKYLNNLRMISAEKYLIDTNMEIIEIAEKVGFKNPSNFTRSFKRFTGLSPSKYRKNNK